MLHTRTYATSRSTPAPCTEHQQQQHIAELLLLQKHTKRWGLKKVRVLSYRSISSTLLLLLRSKGMQGTPKLHMMTVQEAVRECVGQTGSASELCLCHATHAMQVCLPLAKKQANCCCTLMAATGKWDQLGHGHGHGQVGVRSCQAAKSLQASTTKLPWATNTVHQQPMKACMCNRHLSSAQTCCLVSGAFQRSHARQERNDKREAKRKQGQDALANCRMTRSCAGGSISFTALVHCVISYLKRSLKDGSLDQSTLDMCLRHHKVWMQLLCVLAQA